MLFNKEAAILSLLLTLCVLLWFIRSYLANTIYEETPMYLQNEQKISSIKEDNMRLIDDILYSRSYNHIASEAQKMGLTVPANPIFLQ